MELALENGQRIYMDDSIDGAIARLYDENGILVDQMECRAEFLRDVLFGGAE